MIDPAAEAGSLVSAGLLPLKSIDMSMAVKP